MLILTALVRKTLIKTIKKGDTVSYGRTFVADRDIVTATVPVGYADGYRRNLSGKFHVLIRGRKAPILGRICMDQLMVDVTDIPGVKEGDTAILYGDGQPVEAGADIMNTISYELLCVLTKRIRRVYI